MFADEQTNNEVIKELDELILSAYEQDNVYQDPNVVINGTAYYYPASLQLAKAICGKNYDEFRLSLDKSEIGTGLMIPIYLERVIMEGGFFCSTRYAPKQCIGVLYGDVEKNQIKLVKTGVKTEIHEFHADAKRQMNDCFGVQYEIFKYLRDGDLIIIKTIEQKGRVKKHYTYSITKRKAALNGRFLHFKGYGVQFFIPKEDFKCFEGKQAKEKKKKEK